ncbi:hypothetical protein R0137_00100 [Congregibacter brevis]|uniref:Uncharacterized protein n=1 Tax=Congregibacter brevis TaxID=3081201 RepID=A0ABZ0IDV5_9GAMM|nr:hypothetical protein R0137_00100 [Congregibacter sp. IMCC45268]
MKTLMFTLMFFLSASAMAQNSGKVDKVRLPQCEDLADLKEALSKVERMKGFSEGDDYKFLKGYGERCGRYKVRSRSNYTLHSYHNASDNIFAIYRITGGKGYEGGKVVGFMANSVYSKEGWRIARGNECVLTAKSEQCLLPRKCRAITNSSHVKKLELDEFAAPAYCYGVGEDT